LKNKGLYKLLATVIVECRYSTPDQSGIVQCCYFLLAFA
jgi:hypothetical protein